MRHIYFTFLGASLVLFGLGALLTPLVEGHVGLSLLRFIVLCSASASAVAAWGTAAAIASIHKVTWPLYITVTLVVLASAAFAVAAYRHAGSLG
jgi:hypothetical protein